MTPTQTCKFHACFILHSSIFKKLVVFDVVQCYKMINDYNNLLDGFAVLVVGHPAFVAWHPGTTIMSNKPEKPCMIIESNNLIQHSQNSIESSSDNMLFYYVRDHSQCIFRLLPSFVTLLTAHCMCSDL